MGLDWCLVPAVHDPVRFASFSEDAAAARADLEAHEGAYPAALLDRYDLRRAQAATLQYSPEDAIGTPRIGDHPETIAYARSLYEGALERRRQQTEPLDRGPFGAPSAATPAPRERTPIEQFGRFRDWLRERWRVTLPDETNVASLGDPADRGAVLRIADPVRDATLATTLAALQAAGVAADALDIQVVEMQRASLQVTARRDPDRPSVGSSPESVERAFAIFLRERNAWVARHDAADEVAPGPDDDASACTGDPSPSFRDWVLGSWDAMVPDFALPDVPSEAHGTPSPFRAIGGSFMFRGKRVQYCELLPEQLRDAAFEERDPASMLAYADALERFAKTYESGREYRRLAPHQATMQAFAAATAWQFDQEAIEAERRRLGLPKNMGQWWDYVALTDAIAWLRFWAEKGMGLSPWF